MFYNNDENSRPPFFKFMTVLTPEGKIINWVENTDVAWHFNQGHKEITQNKNLLEFETHSKGCKIPKCECLGSTFNKTMTRLYRDGGVISKEDTAISRKVGPPDNRKKLQKNKLSPEYRKYTVQQQNRIIDLMREGYTFVINQDTNRPILGKGNLCVVVSYGTTIPIRHTKEPTLNEG